MKEKDLKDTLKIREIPKDDTNLARKKARSFPKEFANQTMKQLPADQRPYEKCLKTGPCSLSDSELLAVILRSGRKGESSLALANRILKITEQTAYPGLPGLIHLSLPELMKINGIGKVKAIQMKCIGELSRRMAKEAARPGIQISEPSTVAKYFMEQLRHEEQEVLMCMMFDTKNHLLGEFQISRGTVDMAVATPREIFVTALKYQATGIILVHNHPSGDPNPSRPDLDLTARISHAGEMVGIHLIDHIVIGDQRYVSFLESGILRTLQNEGNA